MEERKMIHNQVKKYKVTVRPLEYYHFAKEPNFWTRKRIINNGGTGDGQTPYYVTSEKFRCYALFGVEAE